MILCSRARRPRRSLAWLACALPGIAGHAAYRQPNVVRFMADDFGYEAVRGLSGRDADEACKLQALVDRRAIARRKDRAGHGATAGRKGAGGGRQATQQNQKS